MLTESHARCRGTAVKATQNQNEAHPLRLTGQNLECRNLQGLLMKKFANVFTEKLSPSDRIKCPPVRIELDQSKNIVPRAHTKPFDCPFHLRE